MTASRNVRPRRKFGGPLVGGFTVGQRVRFSKVALEQLPMRSTKVKTGEAVGMSNNHLFLRVRRDGVKEVEGYHPKFWEPDTRAPVVSKNTGRDRTRRARIAPVRVGTLPIELYPKVTGLVREDPAMRETAAPDGSQDTHAIAGVAS